MIAPPLTQQLLIGTLGTVRIGESLNDVAQRWIGQLSEREDAGMVSSSVGRSRSFVVADGFELRVREAWNRTARRYDVLSIDVEALDRKVGQTFSIRDVPSGSTLAHDGNVSEILMVGPGAREFVLLQDNRGLGWTTDEARKENGRVVVQQQPEGPRP